MAAYSFIFRKYSLRLRTHDYGSRSSYFITIDCYRHECRFGNILKKKMVPNDFGKIVENEWEELSKKHPNIELGVHQLMPNHFHAIIHVRSERYRRRKNSCIIKFNLSDIIGGYKSIVSNKCLQLHLERSGHLPRIPLLGKIWKRSFYDEIIRDEPSLKSISRYIRNNPQKWYHN